MAARSIPLRPSSSSLGQDHALDGIAAADIPGWPDDVKAGTVDVPAAVHARILVGVRGKQKKWIFLGVALGSEINQVAASQRTVCPGDFYPLIHHGVHERIAAKILLVIV